MIQNRQQFEELFLKFYPEAVRYIYKLIQTNYASQTRITPKDILNDAYINMVNNPKMYLGKTPNHVKHTILQDCKWKLYNLIEINNRKFKLLEFAENSDSSDSEKSILLDSFIEHKLDMSEQNHNHIDLEPYLNCIRDHKDKKAAEMYIEHLQLDRHNGKIDYLCKKYKYSKNEVLSKISKFDTYLQSRIRYEKIYGKKFKRKEIKPKVKVYSFENLLSEKQNQIKNTYFEIKKLMEEKLSVVEIAEKLNMKRTTVYLYLRRKESWM